MAGGVGSRFWPVSTADFPKQFHDMLGCGQTLIQKTFSRLEKLVLPEHIFVLTNERYRALVLEQLPQLSDNQVLLEPAMRNTAPCILYAALKIKKLNEQAIIAVAPSDHWIEDETAFYKDLQHCFNFCSTNEALVTLGIKPNFPNTGFGYIECERPAAERIDKVVSFREKPSYETAKAFIESGRFLWNAGIFIWSVKSILDAFVKFQPEMMLLFKAGEAVYNTNQEQLFIDKYYAEAENISIDYAILEHASNVYVLPASFDWNDLGTWGSLYDKSEKDQQKNAIINAEVILENAANNIIRTDGKKLIVIDGINDYIIVDRGDVLLIYPKNKEQDIKKIVEKVQVNN